MRGSPITPEVLRALLQYDADTGRMFWRVRGAEWFQTPIAAKRWNARYAAKEAFTYVGAQGYLRGAVLGQAATAHRVAWAIVTGAWPDGEIDHINGGKTDNRLTSLREATASQNQFNRGRPASNTSGFKGVSLGKASKNYRARIVVRGTTHDLGYHATAEDAHNAYAKASAELHGEFGRLS